MIHQSTTELFLLRQLGLSSKARGWLEHSLQQSRLLAESGNLNATADYDIVEALSSRYGRFVDILINKLFRALDQYELMEPGSLIDTINRAEKRHLLSMQTGRELKELRNRIVHEYDPDEIEKMIMDIVEYSRIAIEIHQRFLDYLEREYAISVDT